MNQVENIQARKTTWLINNFFQNGIVNLSANTITPAQANLLNSKGWNHTTKIVLGGCRVDDEVLSILLQVRYEQINTLSLWNNRVTWVGIKQLSQSNWNNITYLTISHNAIGNKGCKFITSAKMSKLSSLRLGSAAIQNEGAMHLSKAKWRIIQIIDLNTNKISGEGVEWLTKTSLNNLRMLNLNNNLCRNDWSILLGEWNRLENIYFSKSSNDEYQYRLKKLLEMKSKKIGM